MDENGLTKTVYLVGDEESPNLGGLIYDNEEDAYQVATDNGLRMWRVPMVLDVARAEEVFV